MRCALPAMRVDARAKSSIDELIRLTLADCSAAPTANAAADCAISPTARPDSVEETLTLALISCSRADVPATLVMASDRCAVVCPNRTLLCAKPAESAL